MRIAIALIVSTLFVTGAAGFLGPHVVKMTLMERAEFYRLISDLCGVLTLLAVGWTLLALLRDKEI